MGRRQKPKAKIDHQEDEEGANSSRSVIYLSSSDDEEANEDLSLKIVEKAMKRASKTDHNDAVLAGRSAVIDLGSSPSEEAEVITDRSGPTTDEDAEVKSKKKKSRKEKRANKNIENQEKTDEILMEEKKGESDKALEILKMVEPNPVEGSDNIVLRKLLRGPRYFDPPDSGWGACYNCGEEGHNAVNCASVKRKKPCFVCGSLEHNAKQCMKGQDCFICKKGGHRAKDCPEKHRSGSQNSKICLKCGDSRHDMFSCRNDYSPEDLKEIQCYICKSFGHLCCVNYVDTGPIEPSCYKCGQLGHTGLACARLNAETADVQTPSSCYRCGEQGHFARECKSSTKASKRYSEVSTQSRRFLKEDKDKLGFKSAPKDLGMGRKRKKPWYEERGNITPRKPKQRGGWITEDPGDSPQRKAKVKSWRSPATPTNKNHKRPMLTAGHYTSSQSSKNTQKFYSRNSTWQGSAKASQHRFSASRFGSSSSDAVRRHYDWW